VLDELLRETTHNIVCPVRADDASSGLQRVADNFASYGLSADFANRVTAVPADLASPQLGLTDEEFDDLASSVDAIIHNAASVNLAMAYDSLKDVNVAGTLEILKLACHGAPKAVHYVSTFTVHTADHNRNETVSEASQLPEPATLLHGYSQTKWVSEKLLEAARDRGLPVSVYRPGHITGHSQTGAANTGDLLHTMVKVCLEVGAAPKRDVAFDLTPVDYVAQAMVALISKPEAINGAYLLTNPSPLKTLEFAQWMQENQVGLDVVSYVEWRDRLVAFAAQVDDGGTIRPLIDILAPRVLDGDRDDATAVHPVFDAANTAAKLQGSAIECPPADMPLLSTYFEFLLKMGAVSSSK